MNKLPVVGIAVIAAVLLVRCNGQDTTQRPDTVQQSSAPPATPVSTVTDWHVISVDSRVIESSAMATKYAWKVTIQNDSSQASGFQGEIEFFDADGFAIDRSPAFDNSRPDSEYKKRDGFLGLNQARLIVPAKSQVVFTGIAYVTAEVAAKVARIEAKIHKEDENEQPATQ